MFNETYTQDIKPFISDWLVNNNKGKLITDPVLSLANRAQKYLWLEREWQNLFKDVLLTIVSSSASLPAGFGREVMIGSDMSGSGKIDFFYKKLGGIGKGYKISDAFTKSGGHSYTITFFSPYYSSTGIWLTYMSPLESFTGTGTENSYFPADLVVKCARYLFMTDKGMDKEYQLYKTEYDNALLKYSNAVQHNNTDMSFKLNDSNGNPVYFEGYSLDGEYSERSIMPNSFIPFGV